MLSFANFIIFLHRFWKFESLTVFSRHFIQFKCTKNRDTNIYVELNAKMMDGNGCFWSKPVKSIMKWAFLWALIKEYLCSGKSKSGRIFDESCFRAIFSFHYKFYSGKYEGFEYSNALMEHTSICFYRRIFDSIRSNPPFNARLISMRCIKFMVFKMVLNFDRNDDELW